MPFMSDKFPRILHFPWSPGAKNDDTHKMRHKVNTRIVCCPACEFDDSITIISRDGIYQG